ncbi:MAG: hypothetical protein E7653_00180 [Ruminococcaceae bacterium]|nr:hypothetical protein [Oscillospiraceae bacterium]
MSDFFKKVGKKVNNSIESKELMYYVAVDVVLLSFLLTVTIYQVCEYRFFCSIRDFFTSFLYYIFAAFGRRDVIQATVKEMPRLDIWDYLPFTIDELWAKLDNFGASFWSLENFKQYIRWFVFNYQLIVCIGGIFLVICILITYVVFDEYTKKHIKEKKDIPWYEQKTKFGRALAHIGAVVRNVCAFIKRWSRIIVRRCIEFVRSFVQYLKKHKTVASWLLFIWLINTNLLAIVIDFFAYFFYFVSSADIFSLWKYFVKFIYDIIIVGWSLPLAVWFAVMYYCFDYWRKDLAIKSLLHIEAKTRGFIKELPIVIMITGTMGKGKTKTAVDIALSKEHEFRDKALELMNNNIMRFNYFDFQAFESDLKQQIAERNIKNLASARAYIWRKRFTYGRRPQKKNIYGYDAACYSMEYNDGLVVLNIWDMLENYAQEYFIYTMSTSLIISNLAVRSDIEAIDEEYFVLFNQNFFVRDASKQKEYSAYSHIIDFDFFRICCQMNKENAIAGTFEFGVVLVTEIGKERGNALENKEQKKNDAEANQKNDGFNKWLKMCRHNATVEGFAFIVFICDEQRASSWGADARDLCEIIDIEDKIEQGVTLIYCWLPYLFMDFFMPDYFNWLKKVHSKGNMNVPAVKRVNALVAAYWRHCEYTMHVYGYSTVMIARQSGTLEDKALRHHPYHYTDKKIYSGRYATDCFKDGMAPKTLKSGTSLYEIDTYKSINAMLEELARQKSYFANDFVKLYPRD